MPGESHWKFVLEDPNLLKNLMKLSSKVNLDKALLYIPNVLNDIIPKIMRDIDCKREINIENLLIFYFTKFLTSSQAYYILNKFKGDIYLDKYELKNLWYKYEKEVIKNNIEIDILPSRLSSFVTMFYRLKEKVSCSEAYSRVLWYVRRYISEITPTSTSLELKRMYEYELPVFIIIDEVVTPLINEYILKSGIVYKLKEAVFRDDLYRIVQTFC